MKLSEVAKLLEGELVGEEISVSDISIPAEQVEGSVCIISDDKLLSTMSGNATAYVLPDLFKDDKFKGLIDYSKPVIFTKKIKSALVVLISAFYPEKRVRASISKSAVISSTATIGKDVSVGDFSIVGEKSVIGVNSVVHPNVVIGNNVKIGENCVIFSNVTIYDNSVIGDNVRLHAGVVIGADGFGYIPGATHTKIPHVGNVVIGDDVEIGSNSTVDRGTIGSTIIGAGCKIDNLVQIAHNVKLGRGCLIASQTGISGSTVVGDYVSMGGQVGLADHMIIGSFVNIAAKSGGLGELKGSASYGGMPMVPVKEWARQVVGISQISDMRKTLRREVKSVSELEKKINGLEKKINELESILKKIDKVEKNSDI